jgi:hypothetical protein
MTIRSILRPLEIFNSRLVFFVVIWYILPVLVFWTKKNLATLDPLDLLLVSVSCHRFHQIQTEKGISG